MATLVDGNVRTFKSVTDLSAGQYKCVKLSAENTVILSSAATDAILGVIDGIPAVGTLAHPANVPVRLRSAAGTIKVMAGGVIAAGNPVTPDSTGKVIATTTAGNQIVGYALEAGADTQIIEVMPSTAKY